jgi:hypothetical protein
MSQSVSLLANTLIIVLIAFVYFCSTIYFILLSFTIHVRRPSAWSCSSFRDYVPLVESGHALTPGSRAEEGGGATGAETYSWQW